MSKKKINQMDVQNGRISILFLAELLMCLFLWAERTARYRYDLIFRQMLPWVLPLLLAAAVVGFAFLLHKAAKEKDTMEKLLSPAFGAYLLVMPIIGIALPLLSYFGSGLEQFKLATESAFYLLIGHFAAYLANVFSKQALSALAWFLAVESAVGIYFYETQLSHAAGFLNAPGLGRLSLASSALVHSLLLGAAVLAAFFVRKTNGFKMEFFVYLIPTALWLLFIWSNTLFSFSFAVRKFLLLSAVGICAVFFLLLTVLFRKKK